MFGARLVVLAAVSAVAAQCLPSVQVTCKFTPPTGERPTLHIFTHSIFESLQKDEAESVTAEASDHPEPEPEEEPESDQRVNSVEEKIEVIDLVVNENEDKDDGVDDSVMICETDKNDSVIFCGSSDNRRITRASLKKDSEYDDDEIVLLKEVEGTKKAAELLEESDFTDSDNDSSVVSVETEVTLDMDKNEAETLKQNGDAPSEDKSKNHSDTESDKLNESLKIDLRPSWQVKKTTLAKTKETTASI